MGYACALWRRDYAAGRAAWLAKDRCAANEELVDVMPVAAVCVWGERGWCGSAGAVFWSELWVEVVICY